MGTILRDLRYGVRVLLKSPGFTAVAVLTLALGMGANAAMFSLVNGVLLRGLPFPQQDRLMVVYTTAPQFPHMSTSYPNFLDWVGRSRSFSGMAAFRSDGFNLTGQGQPERVRLAMVSASFFPMLDIKPVLGRTFTADEDRRNGPLAVVLGTSYWKERFGADPHVIGRTLVLNGLAYTVVGVASNDIALYRNIKAFVPIGGWREGIFWDRSVGMGMGAIGRLRPGVTREQAQSEMTAIARGLAQEFPKENKDKGITLVPLREDLVGDIRGALLVLLGAVGFVLLIACANVANLLLARSAARRREFAIRSALGAGRARLVRQVLSEGLLLAVAGGVLGLVLARGLVALFLARVADDLPAHAVVGMDWTVLVFTVVLSLVASLIFAAAPAFQSSRAGVSEALKEGGRGTSGRHRLQRGLVVGEIALALLLSVGAGLMVRTMWRLWQVDPGFDAKNLLTFYLAGTPSKDQSGQALREGYVQLEDRIRHVPGVESVSIVGGSLPMSGDSELPFWVEGRPHATEQTQLPWALFYMVSAEYQKTFGLHLIRGRFITEGDTEKAPYAVVIDDELARTIFPGEDPLGQRLHLGIIDIDYTIVGIVGHVRHWGLERDNLEKVRSQIYMPFRQLPDALMPVLANESGWVVRTAVASGVMTEQIKHAVFEFNSEMTLFGGETMEEIINDSLSQKRLTRLLLASFAVLALVLAAVGIYGVMSQLVLQSTHDIGVRMALGAAPGTVLAMVLRNAMAMALGGIAAGALGALAATRLMSSMLYGIGATDPLTFVSVAAILAAVALLASYLPARRATKVDPMVVLRYE
jgi:putative ABC transport system permease protein